MYQCSWSRGIGMRHLAWLACLTGLGACTNAAVESPFGAALEPKACECARVDAAVTDIAIALENQNINVQPDEARI